MPWGVISESDVQNMFIGQFHRHVGMLKAQDVLQLPPRRAEMAMRAWCWFVVFINHAHAPAHEHVLAARAACAAREGRRRPAGGHTRPHRTTSTRTRPCSRSTRTAAAAGSCPSCAVRSHVCAQPCARSCAAAQRTCPSRDGVQAQHQLVHDVVRDGAARVDVVRRPRRLPASSSAAPRAAAWPARARQRINEEGKLARTPSS